MGSALLNPETTDSTFAAIAGDSAAAAAGPNPAAFSGSAAALRLQAAERLAAHRSRRGNAQARPAPGPTRPATTRAARIAAVVAERYAHTQSYRAFLAAEAERAVQQARAAAEVATLNAQAVAAAQQSLLDTFDQAAFDQNAAEPDSVREDSPSAEPNAESHREPQVELRQGSQACNRQANQNQFTGNPHAEPPQPRPVELSLWPDLDPASTARSHHPTRPHRSTHEPHPSNLEPRALPSPSASTKTPPARPTLTSRPRAAPPPRAPTTPRSSARTRTRAATPTATTPKPSRSTKRSPSARPRSSKSPPARPCPCPPT